MECWHTLSCFSMTVGVHVQLITPDHCCSISTRSCLTTLLGALISLRATTTCLPTWSTGWDHSVSTVMSWCKMSKLVSAHSRWTSLTQAYGNLFSDASA
jgi:hypothetical protein